MVAVFIFGLHGIATIYTFFKYKKEGLSEGILAIAFMAIVFAIGWTIATMLTNLLFTLEAFIKWYYAPADSLFLQTLRKEISRDTISLLILTGGELGFYYLFLGGGKQKKIEKSKSSQKEAPQPPA
ncbi:MAG: hypothetical protein HY088_02420 [Ignavibacteriales bacterium]|nr:hypothetical protein [Ignavibacteriales bacterium]